MGPVHLFLVCFEFSFFLLVGFVFSFSFFVFGNSSQDTAMNAADLFLCATGSLPSLSFWGYVRLTIPTFLWGK